MRSVSAQIPQALQQLDALIAQLKRRGSYRGLATATY
jgi:hypothetical protein